MIISRLLILRRVKVCDKKADKNEHTNFVPNTIFFLQNIVFHNILMNNMTQANRPQAKYSAKRV